MSSSYLEGRCCPPAAFGHNRDGRRGKLQITYGLLCAADGGPVAVEVVPGNTSDPFTVEPQVRRIRMRFGIDRIALVGDRGMLTTARIREDLEPAGLDWIPTLKRRDIRKPLREDADGGPAPHEPEALVPNAVVEVTGPDFLGERLMVCLNPRLRQERTRRREALLKTAEETLEGIATSVRLGWLKGRKAIDRRVGRDVNRRKVGRHLEVEVTDDAIAWHRREDRIAAEARLDGVHLIRTSLDPKAIGTEAAVEAYRSLATAGRVPEREGQPPVPPGPRVFGGPCPSPCVPVHAGAACRMAHAPPPGTGPVRGRRPEGCAGQGGTRRRIRPGPRRALEPRPTRNAPPTDCRRTADPQPAHAARRSGYAEAQRRDAVGESRPSHPDVGEAPERFRRSPNTRQQASTTTPAT